MTRQAVGLQDAQGIVPRNYVRLVIDVRITVLKLQCRNTIRQVRFPCRIP